MIRETLLSTGMPDDDEITEPPAGILRLVVIGETAYLDWTPTDAVGERTTPSRCSFQVSARSLLLALHAAWNDNHPGAAAIDTHAPRLPDPEPAPRPANSHQPWTPDLDDQLRDTWLAASPTAPALAVIAEIADAMGRSTNGIRARLGRLGCDPDTPGHTLAPLSP